MVQLNDLGDLLESFLELLNLLEMVAQLDDRRRLEHPLRVDDELTMLKGVDVALDEQEIRAGFDGEETRSRDIDTVRVFEMLNGCPSGSFELMA